MAADFGEFLFTRGRRGELNEEHTRYFFIQLAKSADVPAWILEQAPAYWVNRYRMAKEIDAYRNMREAEEQLWAARENDRWKGSYRG